MAEDIGTLVLRIEADTKQLKSELGKVDSSIKDMTSNSKKNFIDFGNVAETALGFGLANLALRAADSIRNFTFETIASTIKTNESEIVGLFGADSITDGKCPDGVDYTWMKRRSQ